MTEARPDTQLHMTAVVNGRPLSLNVAVPGRLPETAIAEVWQAMNDAFVRLLVHRCEVAHHYPVDHDHTDDLVVRDFGGGRVKP